MILRSADETAALGRRIAGLLCPGDVVAMFGDLGAGKTTLARGILHALGCAGEVPSPTFPIVQTYEELSLPIWHVDLYRVEKAAELEELGLDDALLEGALLIEWPERLGERLWPAALRLHLRSAEKDTRALTAQVPPAWAKRWPPQ